MITEKTTTISVPIDPSVKELKFTFFLESAVRFSDLEFKLSKDGGEPTTFTPEGFPMTKVWNIEVGVVVEK